MAEEEGMESMDCRFADSMMAQADRVRTVRNVDFSISFRAIIHLAVGFDDGECD